MLRNELVCKIDISFEYFPSSYRTNVFETSHVRLQCNPSTAKYTLGLHCYALQNLGFAYCKVHCQSSAAEVYCRNQYKHTVYMVSLMHCRSVQCT